MWLFRETLLTIAVFYTCVQAMDIRTFTKDWTISTNNFEFKYIGDIARLDNKFAYSVCKKSEFYLECDIKLETLFVPSSTEDTKICQIKIGTKDKQKEVRALILKLELFGNDKILIKELNVDHKNDKVVSRYLKYSIVDMDKCSKNEVMRSYGDPSGDLTKSGVIMYNETFDIIVADQELCSSADTCRQTFDQWGKRIAGPISFPLNQKYLNKFHVQYLSSIQTFYVVSLDYGRHRSVVTRLGLDGTVTSLMTIAHSDYYKVSSNNYNSFSTCWSIALRNKEVHCVQFAARDGDVRLNVTVPVAESTLPLAVYNLPDGLLLVMIKESDGECNRFEVTKIFTNGHKSSLVIDELDLHCYNKFDLFDINADVKDNRKEICFNFISEKPVYEGEQFIKRSMQYRSKCVSKRDIDKL